jgi:hypothetical protein
MRTGCGQPYSTAANFAIRCAASSWYRHGRSAGHVAQGLVPQALVLPKHVLELSPQGGVLGGKLATRPPGFTQGLIHLRRAKRPCRTPRPLGRFSFSGAANEIVISGVSTQVRVGRVRAHNGQSQSC